MFDESKKIAARKSDKPGRAGERFREWVNNQDLAADESAALHFVEVLNAVYRAECAMIRAHALLDGNKAYLNKIRARLGKSATIHTA